MVKLTGRSPQEVAQEIANNYGRAQSRGFTGFAPMTQMGLSLLFAGRNKGGGGGGGGKQDPAPDPNAPPPTQPQSYQWTFPQYSQSWAFTPPTPTPYMNPNPFDPKKYGNPFSKKNNKV